MITSPSTLISYVGQSSLHNFNHDCFYNLSLLAQPDEVAKQRRLEAAPGFEPGIKVLQTRALPLGYAATTIQLFTRKKVNILNVAENSYSASFTPL
jgi:hypothetical protein